MRRSTRGARPAGENDSREALEQRSRELLHQMM